MEQDCVICSIHADWNFAYPGTDPHRCHHFDFVFTYNLLHVWSEHITPLPLWPSNSSHRVNHCIGNTYLHFRAQCESLQSRPPMSSGEVITICGWAVCCQIKRNLSREEGKYYKEVTCKRVQTATAGLVWSLFMSHGLLIVLFTVF